MSYSSEHKEQSRLRILQAAAKLFCRYGFDAVTLGQIMKQAKMTHGAFYAHFSGKSALYEEALKFAASNSYWARAKAKKNALDINLKALVARYLGKAHVSLEESLSPMTFLVTDASHKEEKVRKAYETCYFDLVDNLTAIMERKGVRNAKVLAEDTIVSLVGTVTVARSIVSIEKQKAFLERAQQRVFQKLEHAPTQ
ncbi:TetR family transcriptional regulator [Marinomonas mediterranea]|uniref:TetR/AcrR family transcriptional regulator n=1 Tax=Marinomonas mediterranea TaxID=119864 RepID=UPI00234B5DCD|nr:TetR/AcrR family transcriptional regulator [Marinomonas mediterranea]WCN11528.1 TetR family transcriptional regulator [Marinomonas mediterranea]